MKRVAVILVSAQAVLLLLAFTTRVRSQNPVYFQYPLHTYQFSSGANDPGFKQPYSPGPISLLSWTVLGTVTTCTMQVDSSADGIAWNNGDVIPAQICTSSPTPYGQVSIPTPSVNYIRINPVAFVGTGTVAAAWSEYVATPVTPSLLDNNIWGPGSNTFNGPTTHGGAATFNAAFTALTGPISIANVVLPGTPTLSGFSSSAAAIARGTNGSYLAIFVGVGTMQNNGTLTFPTAAPHGWGCNGWVDLNQHGSTQIVQTGFSPTTATLTNYVGGVATNFVSTDIIQGTCIPY